MPVKAWPRGSKVRNYRVFRVSIFGIVIMVLGRYLIVGYRDPWVILTVIKDVSPRGFQWPMCRYRPCQNHSQRLCWVLWTRLVAWLILTAAAMTPFGKALSLGRGPENHISIQISHSSFKTQHKGDQKSCFVGSVCLRGVLGPYLRKSISKGSLVSRGFSPVKKSSLRTHGFSATAPPTCPACHAAPRGAQRQPGQSWLSRLPLSDVWWYVYIYTCFWCFCLFVSFLSAFFCLSNLPFLADSGL